MTIIEEANKVMIEATIEINRLREVNAEMLDALRCAETVLILLDHEVVGLGFNGKNILPRVKRAILKARL